MQHLTTQNLILAGVFAHLFLTLSRSIWRRPKQQAQIDAIERKVDGVVSTAQQILPVVQTLNRKTFTTVGGAMSAAEGLSLALYPVPGDKPAGGVS